VQRHRQTGVSAYYRNGDSQSQQFAHMLANTVSGTMELKNAGIMPDSSTNNGQLDSIGNSSEWGFPSTIVEGGFMSNTGDMAVIGAENEEGLKKLDFYLINSRSEKQIENLDEKLTQKILNCSRNFTTLWN